MCELLFPIAELPPSHLILCPDKPPYYISITVLVSTGFPDGNVVLRFAGLNWVAWKINVAGINRLASTVTWTPLVKYKLPVVMNCGTVVWKSGPREFSVQ